MIYYTNIFNSIIVLIDLIMQGLLYCSWLLVVGAIVVVVFGILLVVQGSKLTIVGTRMLFWSMQ